MISRAASLGVLAVVAAASSFAGAVTLTTSHPTSASKRISIPATSISTAGALLRLGRLFGVKMVLGGDLSQNVDVTLHNVTLDEALSAILQPLGAGYSRVGDVVVVTRSQSAPRADAHSRLTAGSQAVRFSHLRPADAERVVNASGLSVAARVDGDALFLAGPLDAIARARAMLVAIDVPAHPAILAQFDDRAAQTRTPAPSATATPTNAQNSSTARTSPVEINGGTRTIEIVNLRSVVPGTSGAASSTPGDVATVVTETLAGVGQEVRATVVPNTAQLTLTGSAYAVGLAKELISRLDQPPKVVILDTQILEVNETVAKNLGLSFAPNSTLTTTYSETTPQPNAAGNQIPLLGLQPLSRTPLSLQFQLGLAISNGKGRVLADPRITTISGRTATIRAGDNLTVLTTTGGSTGTVATTQLQTFQTGVTLDITPVINDDNYIVVTLHPVINNVTSYNSEGIPQIATRDTQTTVGLRDGQTLAIGGLIQDDNTRTTTKIPVLGDLPVVGPLFRNVNIQNSRDELIITVTPHVVDPSVAQSKIPLPPPRDADVDLAARDSVATPAPTVRIVHTTSRGPLSVVAGKPIVHDAVPTATATPTGGATPGTFTYGTPTTLTSSALSDPPKILYASYTPTALRPGANVTVTATTTANVSKVTVGAGTTTVALGSTSPGQWQANYVFTAAGLPSAQSQLQLDLVATKLDGTSTSIQIPVTLSP